MERTCGPKGIQIDLSLVEYLRIIQACFSLPSDSMLQYQDQDLQLSSSNTLDI